MKRNISPEGRAKIAAAQRRRQPIGEPRPCESVAPEPGCLGTFVPRVGNQKRCPVCCTADPYNLAKNKANRARRVA